MCPNAGFILSTQRKEVLPYFSYNLSHVSAGRGRGGGEASSFNTKWIIFKPITYSQFRITELPDFLQQGRDRVLIYQT